MDGHSVELVKLTGANLESTVHKPGSVVEFECIEVFNVAKIQYAFRILYAAIKKTKLLKTIGCFEMTAICGNSGQRCFFFTSVESSRYRRPAGQTQLSCFVVLYPLQTSCDDLAVFWIKLIPNCLLHLLN